MNPQKNCQDQALKDKLKEMSPRENFWNLRPKEPKDQVSLPEDTATVEC